MAPICSSELCPHMLHWDAGFQLSVCYLLRCVFPVSFFDKIQLGEEEVTNPLLLRKHERGLGSSSLQCALFIFQRFLAANIRSKADNQIERITMLLLLHALWKERKKCTKQCGSGKVEILLAK